MKSIYLVEEFVQVLSPNSYSAKRKQRRSKIQEYRNLLKFSRCSNQQSRRSQGKIDFANNKAHHCPYVLRKNPKSSYLIHIQNDISCIISKAEIQCYIHPKASNICSSEIQKAQIQLKHRTICSLDKKKGNCYNKALCRN